MKSPLVIHNEGLWLMSFMGAILKISKKYVSNGIRRRKNFADAINAEMRIIWVRLKF